MTETLQAPKEPKSNKGIARYLKKTIFRKTAPKVGVGLILAILILVIVGPFFIQYSPYAVTSSVNSPPSLAHPFGTDNQGHDLLSQVVWGAYPSLLVALGAAFGAMLLGFIVGVFAGYYGKLEGILSGSTDIILTFPALPIMILIATLFIATDQLITLLLILFLWAPVARSVRTQVLSVKKLPFVEASKTGGMSDLTIVGKVIIPEVGSLAIAYFIINVSVAIVLVTALQFIGVGNPEVVSWGSILYWAQQFGFNAGDWWWVLAPGLMITIVATSFALIGFSFEEMLNPRLRT